MGVNTDAPAVPFRPMAPKGDIPPSGIANEGQRDIRAMANEAKNKVTERQRRFMAAVGENATSSAVPQPSSSRDLPPVEKYANAAASIVVHSDSIQRFIDWVLYK